MSTSLGPETMNMINNFTALSWIALALSILMGYLWTYIFNLDWKMIMETNPNDQEKLLVIGILSARDHFTQRDAIRKTWLNEIKFFDQVSYKFIVGDSDCDIHEKNRKSAYSCEENIIKMPEHQIVPVIITSDVRVQQNYNLKTDIKWNISLTIHYPVVMKRLGLHKAVIMDKLPYRVALFDERREVDIVSARFSFHDSGKLQHSYRYQAIEPVILPKDFVGSIRIYQDVTTVQLSHSDLTNDKKDFCGLISVDYLDDLDIPKPFTDSSITMLGFQSAVHDADSLKSIIASWDELNKEQKVINSMTKLKLKEENDKYGDILFVNVTETYRNLPRKLLEFHKWISYSMSTKFILKTDDDCYVDLEKITAGLKKFQGLSKLWWSNFREDWIVERFGKWEERTFRSSVYPSFACGSGNIVSKDISDWIARNADYLHPYQGEDVSMGIWLSAISVDYRPDAGWKCDKQCDGDVYVIPELNVDEMKWFWKNKQTCGNPCGCS